MGHTGTHYTMWHWQAVRPVTGELAKAQPALLLEGTCLQPQTHCSSVGRCESSAGTVHWKKHPLVSAQRLRMGTQSHSLFLNQNQKPLLCNENVLMHFHRHNIHSSEL